MVIGPPHSQGIDDDLLLHSNDKDNILKVAEILSKHFDIWVCDHEITDDEPGIYCNF